MNKRAVARRVERIGLKAAICIVMHLQGFSQTRSGEGVAVTEADVFGSVFADVSDRLVKSDVSVSFRVKRPYDTDVWIIATSDGQNRYLISRSESAGCIRCELSRVVETEAESYKKVARRMARRAPVISTGLSSVELKDIIGDAIALIGQESAEIRVQVERRQSEAAVDLKLGAAYYELEIRAGDSVARTSFSGPDFEQVAGGTDLATRFFWKMLRLSGFREAKRVK